MKMTLCPRVSKAARAAWRAPMKDDVAARAAVWFASKNKDKDKDKHLWNILA